MSRTAWRAKPRRSLAGGSLRQLTEGVYAKARLEEVAPGMRSALAKACAGLEVGLFVRDLDRDVCVGAREALGAERRAGARVWFHRSRVARALHVPVVVLPIRDNLWSLMARRVR